jgi:hypothetical protein
MSRLITVDFEGVEAGGGRPRIPEGDYGFEIADIKTKKGEESGKNYLDIGLKAIQGNKKGTGKVIRHTCSLKKAALWNFRNLLEACGKQVKAAALKIDLDKLIGLQCAGTVIDDEYEGKKKSIISAFFPLEDLASASETGDELEETVEEEAAEEEVEEKPKASVKKKAKAKVVEEDQEAEASEEEDLFS